MKYVITEQQYKLIRRESDIKRRIDNLLVKANFQNDFYFVPVEHLILHIADDVAVSIANETNLDNDEYITFRNQIKQYIRTNFYEHIKDYWESNKR
jgi:5-formaminoimidazole-4-carboxamide-1-beta-D-ribofuranosyl 5'-monophosphate synthetase